MSVRGQRERAAVVESLDAAQRYGVDADLERIANALLGERAVLHYEREETGRLVYSLDVLTAGTGDAGDDWGDDDAGDMSPNVRSLYESTGTIDALTCGHCGEAHTEPVSTDAMMTEAPLGLTGHVAHRFSWVPWGTATGGDGRCLITTLGRPRMMRLVHLAESGVPLDGLHGLRARVNRYMGAPGTEWAEMRGAARKRSAHHAGAVKGKRRTSSEVARVERGKANEGLPVDVERLARLTQALATSSGSWADRVG